MSSEALLRKKHKNPLVPVSRVLGTVLLLLVVGICIPLTVPRLLGYQIYSVISGSMEPEIPVGSLLYIRATLPEDAAAGDVVAFYGSGGSGSIITHRVVENRVLPRELITKGDANQEQDRNPVPYTDFIGTVERSVPGAGVFAEIFTSRTGKMAASGLIAAAVLLYVLAGILEGNGGRRSWQQEVTENEEKI